MRCGETKLLDTTIKVLSPSVKQPLFSKREGKTIQQQPQRRRWRRSSKKKKKKKKGCGLHNVSLNNFLFPDKLKRFTLEGFTTTNLIPPCCCKVNYEEETEKRSSETKAKKRQRHFFFSPLSFFF